ncbi:MAG: hypothetical protein DRQ78_06785 [Epsilonproteobacteria bacterium]|nr:MAG: hypothetical protein DRQ78_06785 [Campylobacterota bacterium]
MADIYELNREQMNKTIDNNTSFSQKAVSLADTPLYFPEGFEKLFLVIYIIILPYITGLLFLFLYVSSAKINTFLALNNDSSFLLTWAIGYEILAAFVLIAIIKMAIKFSMNPNKNKRHQIYRP